MTFKKHILVAAIGATLMGANAYAQDTQATEPAATEANQAMTPGMQRGMGMQPGNPMMMQRMQAMQGQNADQADQGNQAMPGSTMGPQNGMMGGNPGKHCQYGKGGPMMGNMNSQGGNVPMMRMRGMNNGSMPMMGMGGMTNRAMPMMGMNRMRGNHGGMPMMGQMAGQGMMLKQQELASRLSAIEARLAKIELLMERIATK